MAEYNGSIELISGITQKGGGTFPLASAKDIQVDDEGTRLDGKLEAIDEKLKNPTSTLPTVTENDNGKVLSVVGGAWAAATGAAGGATIPTYDLTAMGLPTVEVNGEVVELVTDTTQIMSDLTSRSVKVTFALSMGGEAASVSKIVNALTGDALGGCIVTSTDTLGDTVVFTNFNIIEGGIVAMSYTLDTLVNPYIDAYMEDALGGDY